MLAAPHGQDTLAEVAPSSQRAPGSAGLRPQGDLLRRRDRRQDDLHGADGRDEAPRQAGPSPGLRRLNPRTTGTWTPAPCSASPSVYSYAATIVDLEVDTETPGGRAERGLRPDVGTAVNKQAVEGQLRGVVVGTGFR